MHEVDQTSKHKHYRGSCADSVEHCLFYNIVGRQIINLNM